MSSARPRCLPCAVAAGVGLLQVAAFAMVMAAAVGYAGTTGLGRIFVAALWIGAAELLVVFAVAFGLLFWLPRGRTNPILPAAEKWR